MGIEIPEPGSSRPARGRRRRLRARQPRRRRRPRRARRNGWGCRTASATVEPPGVSVRKTHSTTFQRGSPRAASNIWLAWASSAPRQSADGCIVGERNVMCWLLDTLAGPKPHPVERVLQERELIGAPRRCGRAGRCRRCPSQGREVGEVVEQPVDQCRLDIEFADSLLGRRSPPELLARHARRQEQPRVNGVGEALDQGAGSEVFGPHRDG